MKLYCLNSEYLPGKRSIIAVVYDADAFRFDTSTLSPFTALQIDEIDPANKTLCLDLSRSFGKTDANGEGKYYVDSAGVLMEVTLWQEVVNG